MTDSVRRVVTGHRDGKAVFASDGHAPMITTRAAPGSALWRVWGHDARYEVPFTGEEDAPTNMFPAPEGFRFMVITIPPDDTPPPDIDPQEAAAEIAAVLPDVADYMEPDNPGMPTTDTIDFGVVLEGEIWLELDDGAETHLQAGDVVVQNGTRHAWRNKSDRPCRMAFTLIGADRR
jgi:hypothetical protein